MNPYVIYGSPRDRRTVGLATVLGRKGLPVEWVEETASLKMLLESRSGSAEAPYLRTPEGFVLGDPFATLEWIERVHPEPRALPSRPIRRVCARLLEDWVDLWLPDWPRRSWTTLEAIGGHLEETGFLLGKAPLRADCMLAAWLETEVLVHDHARAHLGRAAPRLLSFADSILDPQTHEASHAEESSEDVIPISLLGLLEEIGRDYHGYLEAQHRAFKDGVDFVEVDLGLGRRRLPVQIECEVRRMATARELSTLGGEERRHVARTLEPARVWHALTLPPVLEALDVSDPRTL